MKISRSTIDAWDGIQAMLDSPSLSDREKLRRCCNEADVHAALTGDDSLVHPTLRADRQEQIDTLPTVLKRAEIKKRDTERGVTDFFGL